MNPFARNVDGTVDQKHPGRDVRIILVATLWLTVIVSSLMCIVGYSNTPGRTGISPVHWPGDSQIMLDPHRPTMIMFAHPHCSCTQASIDELDQLLAACPGQLNAQVWFVKLDGTPDDWADTALWRKASAILGVRVHRDDGGVEARRFQAETSGQILFYEPDGQLLFHGGITFSRGHAGDNPGLSVLEKLVNHQAQSQAPAQTPVFGCPLFTAIPDKTPGKDVLCQCKP